MSLACLLCAWVVAAEPAAVKPEEAPPPRTVGRHTFRFPILQESAFVTSYVGVRQGAGFVRATGLPLGPAGNVSITSAGLEDSLELGLAFSDVFGVSLSGSAAFLGGTNTVSIVADGARFGYGGEGTAALRFYRNDASGTQLTARVGGSLSFGRELTALSLFDAVLATPGETVASILAGGLRELVLIPTDAYAVVAGVQGAQSLGLLGLQASLGFEERWKTRHPFVPATASRADISGRDTRLTVGAALDLNFANVGVPIGLLGEYVLAFGWVQDPFASTEFEWKSSVAAGVYYTGRANLELGLGAVLSQNVSRLVGRDAAGNAAFSNAPTLVFAQLMLRYIW